MRARQSETTTWVRGVRWVWFGDGLVLLVVVRTAVSESAGTRRVASL
jgi:hypothetical protein